MPLAIFDLDNTLIGDDSDYLWGQYLVEQGIVDRACYEMVNARFYEDYKAGCLDMEAFLSFALEPLTRFSIEQLDQWRSAFIETRILPILLPAASELIEIHKKQGRTAIIITATNAFVTRPIAQLLGIQDLIATEPEIREGRYTGKYSGIPCFREGKVTKLMTWLEKTGQNLGGSWFYSDSHNDLPLLDAVEHPVAVDPDPQLEHAALSRNWEVISLRSTHLDHAHKRAIENR